MRKNRADAEAGGYDGGIPLPALPETPVALKPNTPTLPVADRKKLFTAVVEAQDDGMSVAESRAAAAELFGVTVDDVKAVEQEGIAAGWPPL